MARKCTFLLFCFAQHTVSLAPRSCYPFIHSFIFVNSSSYPNLPSSSVYTIRSIGTNEAYAQTLFKKPARTEQFERVQAAAEGGRQGEHSSELVKLGGGNPFAVSLILSRCLAVCEQSMLTIVNHPGRSKAWLRHDHIRRWIRNI